MSQDLNAAKSAGANVVRLDVAWATLESDGPGIFTRWYANRLATFMARAHQLGLKVIAILFTSPCWASSAPDSLKQGCQGDWWGRGVGWYPPTNAQDFGDFARFITSTYGSDLAAVEIGNEPDQPQGAYWHSSDPAADYARLLKAAYPSAKAGDSSVPVLAGSLSGSDLPFLKALYQDGIQGSYDAIAIHPYSQPASPDAAPPGGNLRWEFSAGVAAIHSLQVSSGDPTPIWVTEFGWSTVTNTPQEQASYVTQGYHILAGMSYVKAGVVYELHDDIGGGAQDAEAHYGLLNADYSPKPAYAAFASVMTVPAAPVLTDPAGGSVIRDQGAVLTFTGEPTGTVTAYIDGVLAGTATADGAGRATLSVQRLLTDGPHSLSATETDPYGNVSSASAPTTFTAMPAPPGVRNPVRGSTAKPAARTLLDPRVTRPRAKVASKGSKATGLRMRMSPLRKHVVRVTCALGTAVLLRCHIALYFHHRLIGRGSVRYHGRRGQRMIVAVHLNSIGRRLIRGARIHLGVTAVASARMPGRHTLTASRHLRLS